MYKILLRILLLGITVIPYFYIQHLDISSGNDQFFYPATKQGSSLITGLSRAKYGIVPTVLETELNLTNPPLNIAISNIATPYGQLYHSFIKKKIISPISQEKTISIVSVSPSSIMDFKRAKQIKKSRESETIIYHLYSIPKLKYLEYLVVKPFSLSDTRIVNWIKNLFIPKKVNEDIVLNHKDGWKEYKLSNIHDPLIIKIKDEKQIRSKNRMIKLEETIDLLLLNGPAIMVRMPIGEKYLQNETLIYPSFDSEISELAKRKGIHYLNYSTISLEKYQYYDYPKNHLESESAKQFTKKLACDIKQLL